MTTRCMVNTTHCTPHSDHCATSCRGPVFSLVLVALVVCTAF